MKRLVKIKLYFLSMLCFVLHISCNSDFNNIDYTSPDLDLILNSDVKTNYVLEATTKSVFLLPKFDNVQGKLSYRWSLGRNKVVSKEPSYTFKIPSLGKHSVFLYAQDSKGKYANVEFKIYVKELPHVYSKEKVVAGYIQSYKSVNYVKWDGITHLIYSFLLPKADGSLDESKMGNLKSYVDEAKKHNVKVLVSVGGASYPGKDKRIFTGIIKNKKLRSFFINNLAKFVVNNEIDGLDIDYEELEGGGANVKNDETNFLEPFYNELRKELPTKAYLTAAVTGGYGWAAYHFRDIGEKMSKVLDFINVMSYDNTGTWSGSPLGAHSSFKDAKGALERYHVDFKIPKDKLVLAIPFYGKDFGNEKGGNAKNIIYADIIKDYNPTADQLKKGNIKTLNHNIFFNSQQIIAKKTEYVKDNGYRGIAIWELSYDLKKTNDLRLIKGILKTLKTP